MVGVGGCAGCGWVWFRGMRCARSHGQAATSAAGMAEGFARALRAQPLTLCCIVLPHYPPSPFASPPPPPRRHQLFVEMVRGQMAAGTQVAADAAAAEAAAAAGKQGVPHTRPADLPVYGKQFMSVE